MSRRLGRIGQRQKIRLRADVISLRQIQHLKLRPTLKLALAIAKLIACIAIIVGSVLFIYLIFRGLAHLEYNPDDPTTEPVRTDVPVRVIGVSPLEGNGNSSDSPLAEHSTGTGSDNKPGVDPLMAGRGDSTYIPKWHPDGSTIFVSSRLGSVYSVNLRTGKAHRVAGYVSDDHRDVVHSPDISPDGRHLAYVGYKHDSDLPREPEYQLEIVVSDIDGNNSRRVTNSADKNIINVNPVWSPDGNRIAFLSNYPVTQSDDESDLESLRPFLVESDGSTLRQLPSPGPVLTVPVWSPDGTKLAITAVDTSRLGDEAIGQVQSPALYTIEINTEMIELVWTLQRIEETNAPAEMIEVLGVAWSPQGKTVAIASRSCFKCSIGLYVVVLDDVIIHKVATVPSFGDAYASLEWSTEGSEILLAHGRLYVVAHDGSYLRDIDYGTYGSWAPDGGLISRFVRDYEKVSGSLRASLNEPQATLYTMNPDGTNVRVLLRGPSSGFSWVED